MGIPRVRRVAFLGLLAAAYPVFPQPLDFDAPEPRPPGKQTSQAQRIRYPRQEPLDSRIQPIPALPRGYQRGFYPVRVPHARETPTFTTEHPHMRGRPATWGAAMPRQPVPADPEPSPSGTLPAPGGDIKYRIRTAIRKDRAERYAKEVEAFRLMEQYRAEKAMLGLCPVDGCEETRLILEGRAFDPEGHCLEHAALVAGPVRLKWYLDAAKGRLAERRMRTEQLRRKLGVRGEAFRCLEDDRWKWLDAPQQRAALRSVFLQGALPEGFPKPGDLGPNGTVPQIADPRDPAGFPYDSIDPPQDLGIRESQGETRSWVETSLRAP